MKYSGIDLHSNNSVITVIDETDRVMAEKRLPNDLTKILAFLAPWKCELAGVVIESTFNWYWLVDGLQAAGFTVHLAHTTAVRQYDGPKHSGDETDARHLAQLLRLGILPTGTILPPEARSVRDPRPQAHATGTQPHQPPARDREHHGPPLRHTDLEQPGLAADGQSD